MGVIAAPYPYQDMFSGIRVIIGCSDAAAAAVAAADDDNDDGDDDNEDGDYVFLWGWWWWWWRWWFVLMPVKQSWTVWIYIYIYANDEVFDVILMAWCKKDVSSLLTHFGVTSFLHQRIDLWSDTKYFYSIHVPGWLLKWLNLITAPGSVSNEPSSVTWLATKYLKTVSWKNHTEKITTLWPQNTCTSFWPKINIPSSYFTIFMLNCLENTLKLLFDSYVTAVKFLT